MNTNEAIGILTEAIMLMERREMAILELLVDEPEGDTKTRILRREIDAGLKIVEENTERCEQVAREMKNGGLRFLDPKPSKIALLRLRGAIREAQLVLGEKNLLPFE